MAISIAGTPIASTTATTTTSFAVSLPTGIVSGELLRVVVEVLSNSTITAPAGWTATSTQTADGFGYERAGSFHRIADGTEGSTVTFTTAAAVTWTALAWRVAGATSSPIEASATPATATSGATVTAPSVTTLTANAMVERVAFAAQQSAAPSIPAGHTLIGSSRSGSSSTDGAISVAYIMQTSAGSSGTADFTISSLRPWIAFTISVAAVPGPTINTQPSPQVAKTGATATFSVSATASTGTLSYQWQVNTGSGWSNVSGATSSSYTTPTLTNTFDQYLYRVNVTDSNGTVASNSAVLDVWEYVFDSAVFDPNVFDTGSTAAAVSTFVKISGVWKSATAFVKISGVWKAATPSVKVSGVWKN